MRTNRWAYATYILLLCPGTEKGDGLIIRHGHKIYGILLFTTASYMLYRKTAKSAKYLLTQKMLGLGMTEKVKKQVE